MIKRIYIYIPIAIILLFVLSSIKQKSKDGFANTPWYKTDYFIIPLISSIFIIAPIIYVIYKYFLVPVRKGINSTA